MPSAPRSAPCLLAGCGKSPPAAVAPKPLTSGIDRSNFDEGVRPQDDFYRHVDGGWLARTEIPADKSNYGAFIKLDDDAQQQLKDIIDAAAADPGKKAGSDEQKVGDYYAAFMDEAKADALGIKPLDAELAGIAAIKDRKELPVLLARLDRLGVGVFRSGIQPDAKNSSRYIFYVEQGGTHLPDRDYYLDKDAKFAGIRKPTLRMWRRCWRWRTSRSRRRAPRPSSTSRTKLAQLQWPRVDTRDAEKTYNHFEFAALGELMPGFNWTAYNEGVGVTASPGVVIGEPSFFKGWDRLLATTPLETVRCGCSGAC